MPKRTSYSGYYIGVSGLGLCVCWTWRCRPFIIQAWMWFDSAWRGAVPVLVLVQCRANLISSIPTSSSSSTATGVQSNQAPHTRIPGGPFVWPSTDRNRLLSVQARIAQGRRCRSRTSVQAHVIYFSPTIFDRNEIFVPIFSGFYLVGAACARWKIGGSFDKVLDQNSPPIFCTSPYFSTPLTRLPIHIFIPPILFFKFAPSTKTPLFFTFPYFSIRTFNKNNSPYFLLPLYFSLGKLHHAIAPSALSPPVQPPTHWEAIASQPRPFPCPLNLGVNTRTCISGLCTHAITASEITVNPASLRLHTCRLVLCVYIARSANCTAFNCPQASTATGFKTLASSV